MSILNQTNDGLFNVLIALAKCLATIGTCKKEKLLDYCSPLSLSDQDMAKKTLRRWTQIGFFSEENDLVHFSSNLKFKYSRKHFDLDELRDDIRNLIYAERNNERFWENEKNQSADMCRLTAWMLAQDIHIFLPENFSEADDLYVSQLEMENVVRQFTNSTRWNGFTSWGVFLGFGHIETGKASGALVLDPTVAIRKAIQTILGSSQEIAVNDFLDELAELVPVIDRGHYRKEVESRLKPGKWEQPGKNDFSTSLSRALLRLRESGHIRFEERSDAGAQMKLIGRDGRVVESLTHVRKGESK